MLKREFRRWMLPVPPLPSRFQRRLLRVGELYYSTRDPGEVSPYNIQHYVSESTTGVLAEYATVAHAGHGINSWALHYYIVTSLLAIFVQTSWGGVYENDAQARSRIADLFDACESLQDVYGIADYPEQPVCPAKIVVSSDFYGNRIGIRRDKSSFEWRNCEDPIREALGLCS